MKSRQMMLALVLVVMLAGALAWECWPDDETGRPATAQTGPEAFAVNKAASAESISTSPAKVAPKTQQVIEVKAWTYETTAWLPGLSDTFDPVKFAQSPPPGFKLEADSTALLNSNGRVIVYSGTDGVGTTIGNYTQTEPGVVVGIEQGKEDNSIKFGSTQITGDKARAEFRQDGLITVMGGVMNLDSFPNEGGGINISGGTLHSGKSFPGLDGTTAPGVPNPIMTRTGSTDSGSLALAPGDNPGKNSLLVAFGPQGTDPRRFAVLTFRILSAEEAAKLPAEKPEKN
jgi:hypothetical protein